MKKIAKQLTDLVGNTPLLELSNYNKSSGSEIGVNQSCRKREGPCGAGHD